LFCLEAKKLWEKVRQKKIENETRKELVETLIGVVQGKIHHIVFKSDASRVIQCILKHGNEEHRKIVFNELKGTENKFLKCLRISLDRLINDPKYRSYSRISHKQLRTLFIDEDAKVWY